MWDKAKEPYVFLKHRNRVFFYPDMLDMDWWFILRHDLTLKHIFENNNVIMLSEEDNQGDENRE